MPIYKEVHLRRVMAVLLLIILSFSGCKRDTVAGKGFRFPISAEPRQIDPQVSTDAPSVTMVAAVFEGLARLDENGNAQPAAARWTVSEDLMTYTFTLRESKWSDGSPVTARDFVFGLQRVVMPTTHSALSSQLFNIKNARKISEGKLDVSKLGVKAINDKQLTISLISPDNDFPTKTTATPFMPCKQSFFESTGGRYGLDAEYILTNGAFFLKSWTHNESLLLNKHDGYHAAENILPAAVRYMIGAVKDPVTLLSEGLLDAAPIPTNELSRAKEAGLTLITREDTVNMMWLNNSTHALANVKIRKALRDALEWNALYSLLNENVEIPATGLVAPDATAPGGKKFRNESNIKKAASRGSDAAEDLYAGLIQAGLREMPSMTLLCADDDHSENLARFIVQSWQKNLSLYFSVETVSESELATRVKVGNYQIALYASSAPGAGALDALGSYGTGAVGNYSHFSDKAFDSKLAKAGKSLALSDIEALETQLWQACPSIPLSFNLSYVGIPKGNSGIIVRSFGGGVFGAPYDFHRAGKKG